MTNTNRVTAAGGAMLTVALLGTVVTSATSSPAESDKKPQTQKAESEGAAPAGAVQKTRDELIAENIAELERTHGSCEHKHAGSGCPRYAVYRILAESAADRQIAGKPRELTPGGWSPPAEQAATIVPPEPQPEVAEPTKIEWHNTWQTAQAEQAKTGRPILLLRTRETGCTPCRTLEIGPFQDPEVIAWINSETVPLRMSPEALGQAESSTPIIFFQPAGQRMQTGAMTGSRDPVAFLRWLKERKP